MWVQLNFFPNGHPFVAMPCIKQVIFLALVQISFTICDILCHMSYTFGCISGLSILYVNLCIYVSVHVLIILALEHVLIFGKVNSHSLPLIFRIFLAMFYYMNFKVDLPVSKKSFLFLLVLCYIFRLM